MKTKTSWEKESSWYDEIVGIKGHYYHKHIIIPKSLSLLKLSTRSSVLDLGCGQGVFARALPKKVSYTGIDSSKPLIEKAKKYSKHTFLHLDACKKLTKVPNRFSHALMMLSLQNMEHPEKALKNASLHLKEKGILLIVLNHPCFRIPRQSSWEIDRQNRVQSRKISRYMSSLKIPIQTHPGKSPKEESLSFHHSLSNISSMLFDTGFSITKIEEWCSNKKSTGKYARMENRARLEFPLFMAILAKSNS